MIDQIADTSTLIDAAAESSVLATFLNEPAIRKRLYQELDANAFTLIPHAKLWSMLRGMFAGGLPIAPDIVEKEARRRSLGIERSEFNEIFRHHVSDCSTDVRRVKDMRRRRWAYEIADSVRRDIVNQQIDVIDSLEHATKKFKELIRRASRPIDGAESVLDLHERLRAMEAGKIRNIHWPDGPMMSTVARALESCSITMLGGQPGDGKTFLVLQSLVGWIEQGINVSVVMLEKRRPWHMNRCIAVLEGDHRFLKGEYFEQNKGEADRVIAKHEAILARIGTSIHESNVVGNTLGDLARWIDQELQTSEIVIVDPISLADAGDKRWVADGDFIKSVINSTEETNGRVVLVTHPNSSKGPASLATMMGGQVYQRATDAVLYVTKYDKPKRFDVLRKTLGHSDRRRVVANRMISVFKGRNATQSGAKFAFAYENLRYVEQGLILKEPKDDDEDDRRQEADEAAARIVESNLAAVMNDPKSRAAGMFSEDP